MEMKAEMGVMHPQAKELPEARRDLQQILSNTFQGSMVLCTP